jgi:hypothetical protein
MRFSASQDAVSSGAIGQDQVLSGDSGLSMDGAAGSLSGTSTLACSLFSVFLFPSFF